MRIISEDGLAALDSGRFGVRCLLRVDVPGEEEPFAIWDDLGSLDVDGVIYVGAAGRFNADASISTQSMSINNLDVRFPAVDTEVAAMIEATAWHQAPVLLQRAIIATESPAVLHLLPEFSGHLDQFIWREVSPGVAEMVFRLESASRELARSGSRTRSEADQRQRDPDDGFYKFAISAISTSINWGRSPENLAKQKKPSSFLDKIF